jgi:hypothetical protein
MYTPAHFSSTLISTHIITHLRLSPPSSLFLQKKKGSGSIDIGEMRAAVEGDQMLFGEYVCVCVCVCVCNAKTEVLIEVQVKSLFDSIDSNKDGKISLEYVHYYFFFSVFFFSEVKSSLTLSIPTEMAEFIRFVFPLSLSKFLGFQHPIIIVEGE